MENEELMHYGVLGMKWGVRKANIQAARAQARVDKLKIKKREQDKLLRAKTKVNKLNNEEAELKRKLKGKDNEPEESKSPSAKNVSKHPKKLSDVSDEDLRVRINRLEMEKRYKDLVSEKYQKEVKAGKGAFRKWASESAKTILVDTSVDLGKQAFKHMAAKKINEKMGEIAVYSNNKKKS